MVPKQVVKVILDTDTRAAHGQFNRIRQVVLMCTPIFNA